MRATKQWKSGIGRKEERRPQIQGSGSPEDVANWIEIEMRRSPSLKREKFSEGERERDLNRKILTMIKLKHIRNICIYLCRERAFTDT